MLRSEALSKTYASERGPIEAVASVSLEVPKGGYAAVIGRSGSGKSSLLAMLGGLSRPSAGKVEIDDQDLWALDEAKLAAFRRRHIGFVFQFASLLPNLTLLDNVALPALLDGAGVEAQERAQTLLANVGLAGYPDAFPGEVSAGEQRRAAVARALINQPSLLLADEPTADLDAVSEAEILEGLQRAHRDEGITLVLVTHNLDLAEEAAQVFHIADGVLVE